MKYVYATLLLIGLSLSSCTNQEWTPGEQEPKDCYNVYFPEQEVSGNMEINPTDALEFSIILCRENIDGDVVVPLNIDINTQNKFTVSEAVFYDGSDEAEITVTLSDDIVIGESYDLGISVTDSRFVPIYTSDASKPVSHRISVTRVTWRTLGMINYTDDIIYSALTGQSVTYPVELQVREDTVKDMDALLAAKNGNGSDEDLAGIYRLVNPYNAGPFAGDTTIGQNTISHAGVDSYVVINAMNINQVYIPLTTVDLIINGGTLSTYVYSLAAYELDNGADPLELYAQYFGAIRNGSIVFDYDVILYALSDRTENSYLYGNPNYAFRVEISPTSAVYELDMPYFDDGDFTFTPVAEDKTFYSEARQESRTVVLEKGEPNVTTNDVHRDFYNRYGTLYRLVNPYNTDNAGRPIPIYFSYKDGAFTMHPDYQYQLTGHLEGGMYVYLVVNTEKSTFDPQTCELTLVSNFLGGDMYKIYFDYGLYREVLSSEEPDFTVGGGSINFKEDFAYESVFTGKFNSKFNNIKTRDAVFEKGTCINEDKKEAFEKEYAGVYRIRNAYADGYDIYFCADKDGKVVLPDEIGMQQMGTEIFGVPVYVTIESGTVNADYGCFLNCLFTSKDGFDVSAAYPASYGVTTKESLWNYVWYEVGTASYRSVFHYDEIGIEVPDEGLKVYKTEAMDLYRIDDYLRAEGSDADLEFYWNRTTNKIELNGIHDTKVLYGKVDPTSQYADLSFTVMDGAGYINDMFGYGMTWAEIEENFQITQSNYSASTKEIAFNLIYYVPGVGIYPQDGTLSVEVLKFDQELSLDLLSASMPQVFMSSVGTRAFQPATKPVRQLGRAFVPKSKSVGMADVEPQPYSRAKIAVE